MLQKLSLLFVAIAAMALITAVLIHAIEWSFARLDARRERLRERVLASLRFDGPATDRELTHRITRAGVHASRFDVRDALDHLCEMGLVRSRVRAESPLVREQREFHVHQSLASRDFGRSR